MRILYLLMLCFLMGGSLLAQERSNRRLHLETGFLLSTTDSEGLALRIGLEPQVEIRENLYAGLQISLALNTNNFENNAPFQYDIDRKYDTGLVGFVPSLDYFLKTFYWKETPFRPYLGGGVGYYLLYGVEVLPLDVLPLEDNKIEIDVEGRIGLLLRGGVEWHNWRLGLAYTLLPKAELVLPEGQEIGVVDNRNLALSIGLVIGARKDLERL